MHGLAVRVPYDNAKSIKGSGFRTLGLERNHPKLVMSLYKAQRDNNGANS